MQPAHDEFGILRDAVICLLAVVIVVPAFERLRVNPIIGYLAAGVAIGPHALGLVGDVEGTHRLAELGVVFMLFAVGLELSFDRLRTMAHYIFGLGSLQVAVTGLLIGAAAALAGAGWGQASIIGGALALSSTAFVLQLLAQRGELTTRLGRVTLAILLLQDLAVVPGIAVVTALGDDPERLATALSLAAAKAVAALVVLLVAGRILLRPLYRRVARTRNADLFAATTLLAVLGTAWAMEAVGLSMALGAFMAGLLLAGTEYRHQIEADIRPVRGILLGLFFVSIGMLIDAGSVLSQVPLLALAVTGLVAVKALTIAGLGRLFRLPASVAVSAGLHLAQGGEFAFVLFSLALANGALPAAAGQFLLSTVAVSMALTPLLAMLGRRLSHHIERRRTAGERELELQTEGLSGHVVIAGFGRVGRLIARMLDELGHPWVAVDLDTAIVSGRRDDGQAVFFGDASNERVLEAAGAERARAAVITLDDPEAALAALRSLRRRLPELPVVVRARDSDHLEELLQEGATSVVPETVESSLSLAGRVLRTLGTSGDEVEGILQSHRERLPGPDARPKQGGSA